MLGFSLIAGGPNMLQGQPSFHGGGVGHDLPKRLHDSNFNPAALVAVLRQGNRPVCTIGTWTAILVVRVEGRQANVTCTRPTQTGTICSLWFGRSKSTS